MDQTAGNFRRVEDAVCSRCSKRFYCFTIREQVLNGLCNPDAFCALSPEEREKIFAEKAKRQGRYHPTEGAGLSR